MLFSIQWLQQLNLQQQYTMRPSDCKKSKSKQHKDKQQQNVHINRK